MALFSVTYVQIININNSLSSLYVNVQRVDANLILICIIRRVCIFRSRNLVFNCNSKTLYLQLIKLCTV